jgi:Ni/Co efflux regulator RcnB
MADAGSQDEMNRARLILAGLLALIAAWIAAPAMAEPHPPWRGQAHGSGPHGYVGGVRRSPVSGPQWVGAERWNRGGPYARPAAPPAWGPAWDDQRNNGYWLNNHWHYGPPPDEVIRTPGLRPGFAPWRRGGVLPPYYAGDVVGDFDRYHLRRPPYGFNWVRVGQSFLLVSTSSGMIFDVIEGY